MNYGYSKAVTLDVGQIVKLCWISAAHLSNGNRFLSLRCHVFIRWYLLQSPSALTWSLCAVSTEQLIPTLLTSFVARASYLMEQSKHQDSERSSKRVSQCELFLFLIIL